MMETDSCPEISVLSSFLDDELEEGKNEAVKLHVQNCPACADQVKRLQTANRLVIRHLAEPMFADDSLRKGDCLTPEVMTSYLHDLLSTEEKRRAESHLDTCDACLSEF